MMAETTPNDDDDLTTRVLNAVGSHTADKKDLEAIDRSVQQLQKDLNNLTAQRKPLSFLHELDKFEGVASQFALQADIRLGRNQIENRKTLAGHFNSFGAEISATAERLDGVEGSKTAKRFAEKTAKKMYDHAEHIMSVK